MFAAKAAQMMLCALLAIPMVSVAQESAVPLAQRIAHTDPAKY